MTDFAGITARQTEAGEGDRKNRRPSCRSRHPGGLSRRSEVEKRPRVASRVSVL